jgi:cell division protein ZapA (FtsZ GTPase activity inhibitor)
MPQEAMNMPTPKRIEVRIGGSQYTLLTGDDEAIARRVAAQADQLVRRILQNNPALNQTAALVLGLVNTIDESLRTETRLELLEGRLNEAEGRVTESRTEMLRFKEKVEAANVEMQRLRMLLERSERDARRSDPDGVEVQKVVQSSFMDGLSTRDEEPSRDTEEC